MQIIENLKFDEVMDVDTSQMSANELKSFIQTTMIPVLNKKWGKGGYVIAMCDSNDFVVIQLCEDCGLGKADERYYFGLSDDDEIDLEDYINSADYDDNGFELPMSRDIDDCECDEDYE